MHNNAILFVLNALGFHCLTVKMRGTKCSTIVWVMYDLSVIPRCNCSLQENNLLLITVDPLLLSAMNSLKRTRDNIVKLGVGEETLSRQEYPKWQFSTKRPALKVDIKVILYRLNALYLKIFLLKIIPKYICISIIYS